MEHVPDPQHFLNEINTMLQPGGVLIMTTPFMVQFHEEPYDFYRCTKRGIQHLLSKSGFEVKSIKPFGGAFAATLGVQIQLLLKIWSVLANASRIKIIYSEWNPFIFFCGTSARALFSIFKNSTFFRFKNIFQIHLGFMDIIQLKK